MLLSVGNELDAFRVPRYVEFACGIELLGGSVAEFDGVNGGIASPLVDFSMTIGEGEPCGSIMVGSRTILPVVDIRVSDEECVIDRIWVFVECQVGHAR